MHILQPRARRAHRHPPTDTFSPIVGNVYPIQMYILENAHSPTLRPKGAQTPSKLTHFPQMLAMYIQYKCIF